MADRAELIDTHPPAAQPWRALANRNFRLLWLGEMVSLFGDQFYLVALPWLVFQMTGSSLAFGTILTFEGIPRAVLLLLGGVVTDRVSPRAVMLASNLLRFAITLLLTLVVAGQVVQLWMLYAIAFCFGVVDAFFHPAYRAMTPLIVAEDDLQPSNALMLGAAQLVQIAGPGVAGVIVGALGTVVTFAFDALTFLFAALTQVLMRVAALPKPQSLPNAAPQPRGLAAELGDLLAFVRQNRLLRVLIYVLAAINFLFAGPLIVGTATLVRLRFREGAAAFGALLSTFAVGVLIGTLVAGVVRPRRPGLVSLLLVAAEGVCMIGIAQSTHLILDGVLYVLIGFGAGFGNVNVVTLTQRHVDKTMMGRVMSLFLLAEVGLTPFSNALAGVVADWNVTALFSGAGALLTLAALLALTQAEMRAPEPA